MYNETFKNTKVLQKDMNKKYYAIAEMEQNYQECKGGK
jgi:hypothetical protein